MLNCLSCSFYVLVVYLFVVFDDVLVPKLTFFLNCNFLKGVDLGDPSSYAPIIITRLERINWDAIMTNQLNYSQIRVQVHAVAVIVIIALSSGPSSYYMLY